MQCSLVKLTDKAQKGEGACRGEGKQKTQPWTKSVDCANVEGKDLLLLTIRTTHRERERESPKDGSSSTAADEESATAAVASSHMDSDLQEHANW